jgi:peptidoglycan/LPS O-acetylase OafA/YrhL
MPNETNKFYWLDLLRGLAAVAVFAGHLRSIFFLDYQNIKPNSVAKIFYFITGFGHQSVIIFFVLSGFFIAKTIQESIDRRKWTFKDYFINRFMRLQVVLLPALLLGLFWDSLGLTMYPDSVGYSGQIPTLPEAVPTGRLGFTTFIGNILFLQTIYTPTFGSNSPMWSLANEFWYYMIFPLIYFSIIPRYSSLKRLLFLLIASFILIIIGYKIALYFLVWLMGAFIYYYRKNYIKLYEINTFYIKTAILFVLGLFLLMLFYIRLGLFPTAYNDFSLGIVSGVFILLLSFIKMDIGWLKNTTIYLSNISYTLYLTHIPAALFLCSIVSINRHDWDVQNLMDYTILFFVILLYATLCWYLFERNTNSIKKFIKKSKNTEGPLVLADLSNLRKDA